MTKLCKEFHKKVFGNSHQQGGAAIEYILVSVFGLLLSIAAIGFVSQAAKSKLSQLEQKLGIELNLDQINPFSENDN